VKPGETEAPEPTPNGEAPERSTVARAAPFTVDGRRSIPYRIERAILLSVLRAWFRPVVRGRVNIPSEGPAILAPVHRSYVDFAFPGILTRRKLFFMAKEELWKWAWFGRVLKGLGAFPVHRSGADRESVRRAEEVLRSGQLLVMFPEGSRRFGDTVGDLLEGVAFLSARTGAPIVPIGIAGSERAMPKGSVIPKPYRVTVSIGQPLSVPDRTGGRRVARSQVHELAELLREKLQAAYDDAGR
jgi:1-acyl-sn-glycerol-3-phosphate acyltransferase